MLVLYCVLDGCAPKSEKAETVAVSVEVKSVPPVVRPTVDTVLTLSDVKLKLTAEYCLENYGVKSFVLDTPRMIVVHYTAIPDLKTTLSLFKRNYVSPDRDYIKQFSTLNVGIHYVIDKDGKIYNLLPDSVVARHLIGFNHVSLGIENVAADSSELTPQQLQSNIQLIRFLGDRHASIKFLIGHGEYNRKELPHFSLFKSINLKYAPYDKTDPGRMFMNQIRDSLSLKYGLAFEK